MLHSKRKTSSAAVLRCAAARGGPFPDDVVAHHLEVLRAAIVTQQAVRATMVRDRLAVRPRPFHLSRPPSLRLVPSVTAARLLAFKRPA